ncbi:MAG: nuclear transport factor 2 family protein [Deltaproteobacteria bacterium]|jgi:hypothetical protein|nr:nuclear transport factor 2 family protein [Deltaproteobacteria bacterium]
MPTLEERVKAIEDRESIRELTARYCQLVVSGRSLEVADLFTEDGVMEFEENVTRGREALKATYRDAVSDLHPIPTVHNHLIELDGDRATGFCSLELRTVENGEAITGAGHYEDSFERVGGEWKFSHRKLILYHRVPLSQGWA